MEVLWSDGIYDIECNKFVAYSLDPDKLDIWCTVYVVVSIQYHTYTIQSHDIFATHFHGLTSISVYHIVVFGHMMYRYMCWYVCNCICLYRTYICCNLVDTPVPELDAMQKRGWSKRCWVSKVMTWREPQSVGAIWTFSSRKSTFPGADKIRGGPTLWDSTKTLS